MSDRSLIHDRILICIYIVYLSVKVVVPYQMSNIIIDVRDSSLFMTGRGWGGDTFLLIDMRGYLILLPFLMVG